jgi:hypothetical protein
VAESVGFPYPFLAIDSCDYLSDSEPRPRMLVMIVSVSVTNSFPMVMTDLGHKTLFWWIYRGKPFWLLREIAYSKKNYRRKISLLYFDFFLRRTWDLGLQQTFDWGKPGYIKPRQDASIMDEFGVNHGTALVNFLFNKKQISCVIFSIICNPKHPTPKADC